MLDVKKILGQSVREMCVSQNLTQEQLAEYLDVQTHTINRLETGRNFVSSEVLNKLCNYFNVAPSVLFTPKPQIMLDKHIDYSKEIIRMLPGYSAEKLQELYNIMLVMKK